VNAARPAWRLALFGTLAVLSISAQATEEPVLEIAERITATLPGTSDREPDFVREWKQFAEASGRVDDRRWVELIRHPNAVRLSNAWSAWRGFDAPTLVAEARIEGRIPPEVAPGLVITAANVDSIPGLAALMTPELAQQVKSDDWYHIKKIRIVPTSHYYLSAGKLRGFLDESGEFFLDPDDGALRIRNCTTCEKGAVVEEDWGQKSVRIPFVPDPKTGLELVWAFAQHNVGSDSVFFKPGDFILCDKHNRIERTYSAHLWWQNFWGRATFEPTPSIPGIPEDSYQGGSIFFTHPLDAKGLCGVRIRRFDPDVDDSFAIFVPYLRRTRILSGSDTQDPLCAGCDLIWDDWRGFWQRIDPRKTEYTIESKDEFILALPERGMVGDQFEIDDCQFDDMQMEIRPVSRLLIKDRTGKYVYSSRRIWVDRDWWHMQLAHAYDATGRMWRWGSDVRYWDPRTGEASWQSAFITDPINRHGTMLRANSDFTESMRGTKQEYFDIESLKNYQ
jgi:hypothetical protein